MTDYALPLIQRYRQAGVLVDSNLLLLLLVGSFNRELITRFRRTAAFLPEDYDLVLKITGYFSQVLTTPHILAEVSNLAGQLPSDLKPGWFAIFAETIGTLVENYVPSVDLATLPQFRKFGLTDTGIMHDAQNRYLVLTAAFPLSNYLESIGSPVLNYNHIRGMAWT